MSDEKLRKIPVAQPKKNSNIKPLLNTLSLRSSVTPVLTSQNNTQELITDQYQEYHNTTDQKYNKPNLRLFPSLSSSSSSSKILYDSDTNETSRSLIPTFHDLTCDVNAYGKELLNEMFKTSNANSCGTSVFLSQYSSTSLLHKDDDDEFRSIAEESDLNHNRNERTAIQNLLNHSSNDQKKESLLFFPSSSSSSLTKKHCYNLNLSEPSSEKKNYFYKSSKPSVVIPKSLVKDELKLGQLIRLPTRMRENALHHKAEYFKKNIVYLIAKIRDELHAWLQLVLGDSFCRSVEWNLPPIMYSLSTPMISIQKTSMRRQYIEMLLLKKKKGFFASRNKTKILKKFTSNEKYNSYEQHVTLQQEPKINTLKSLQSIDDAHFMTDRIVEDISHKNIFIDRSWIMSHRNPTVFEKLLYNTQSLRRLPLEERVLITEAVYTFEYRWAPIQPITYYVQDHASKCSHLTKWPKENDTLSTFESRYAVHCRCPFELSISYIVTPFFFQVFRTTQAPPLAQYPLYFNLESLYHQKHDQPKQQQNHEKLPLLRKQQEVLWDPTNSGSSPEHHYQKCYYRTSNNNNRSPLTASSNIHVKKSTSYPFAHSNDNTVSTHLGRATANAFQLSTPVKFHDIKGMNYKRESSLLYDNGTKWEMLRKKFTRKKKLKTLKRTRTLSVNRATSFNVQEKQNTSLPYQRSRVITTQKTNNAEKPLSIDTQYVRQLPNGVWVRSRNCNENEQPRFLHVIVLFAGKDMMALNWLPFLSQWLQVEVRKAVAEEEEKKIVSSSSLSKQTVLSNGFEKKQETTCNPLDTSSEQSLLNSQVLGMSPFLPLQEKPRRLSRTPKFVPKWETDAVSRGRRLSYFHDMDENRVSHLEQQHQQQEVNCEKTLSGMQQRRGQIHSKNSCDLEQSIQNSIDDDNNNNETTSLTCCIRAAYVLVEYPGYGLSDGLPSPSSCVDSGIEAVRNLLSRTNSDTVEIHILGYSLGCAVALRFANMIADHVFINHRCKSVSILRYAQMQQIFSMPLDLSKCSILLEQQQQKNYVHYDEPLSKIARLRNVVLISPFSSTLDCANSLLGIPKGLQKFSRMVFDVVSSHKIQYDNHEAIGRLMRVIANDPALFYGLTLSIMFGDRDILVPSSMAPSLAGHARNVYGRDKLQPSGIKINCIRVIGADHSTILDPARILRVLLRHHNINGFCILKKNSNVSNI